MSHRYPEQGLQDRVNFILIPFVVSEDSMNEVVLYQGRFGLGYDEARVAFYTRAAKTRQLMI
jgi:hypothetical protein